MKKNIKLLALSKNELGDVKGSKAVVCTCCSCACLYEGPQEGPDDDYYGGASTEDNGSANSKAGVGSVSQSAE